MNIDPETIFLLLWIGFLLLGVGSAFAFIWWGVRSRQFSDQDRARSLPLHSRIIDHGNNDEQTEKREGNDS